ncbi:uncharacterized protein J4E78_009930 [Alternaria triticimaculans]|uniref:uncharacterized protein n=1 Tax=Alternaria triticimaculans TaxID=297637 RepID=UPI0020C22F7F|nr:uncharacterized protein J4E78_009930 [Alternaria triticimaculans]KAI4643460.1 hypothetical protein J4E78_009930 [Alternaria triticimaculans]
MPAIHHIQARFLEDSNGNGGISPTAIALIVCLGIVPCIILIWAVCYLFWAYPYDRNCCCIKRKRRPEPQSVLNQAPMSEETLFEKQGVAPPQRPFSVQTRTESGSSNNNGRLQKQQRPGSGVDTRGARMSQQSVMSANTMTYAQEPQRFV